VLISTTQCPVGAWDLVHLRLVSRGAKHPFNRPFQLSAISMKSVAAAL
jgi:hypothetical protein